MSTMATGPALLRPSVEAGPRESAVVVPTGVIDQSRFAAMEMDFLRARPRPDSEGFVMK